MKIKKRISYYIFTVAVFVVIILGITITSISKHSDSYADASTGVDIHQAIQQTAYSYYMRGPNLQYNTPKGLPVYTSPEETTSQDMNYTTCSNFIGNVFYELLNGVKIPLNSDN